jgi:tripartite-type tricarboxylate transporter receptor subunit TctC
MAEVVPGVVVDSWQAFLLPAGVPADIAGRLHAEITAVIALPAVQQFLREQAFVAVGGTPEALGAVLRAEVLKWRRVVQETALRLN